MIVKAALDSPVLVDKEKRDRVRGALKQILGNLTDIGRKEKLVHILHEMGIYKIETIPSEETVYSLLRRIEKFEEQVSKLQG